MIIFGVIEICILVITLNLKGSKTNKTFKIETLSVACHCTINKDLCLPHHMLAYQFAYKILFNNHDYLFKKYDGKLVLGFEFRRALDEAFRFAGINPEPPFWRAHSLRHGEMTDLQAANVSLLTLQRFGRHAPGSKSTHFYTKTTSEEDANLIFIKYKQQYENFYR